MAAVCLGLGAEASAQYRFDTWTTDNGLPQNGVRQITQTPDGYLWFTTFDGLVRFDGIRFTTFGTGNTKGIINNRFTGLYGDKDGTLYATTMEDGVLTVYRDGVFTSYSSQQVPGHYIQRIQPDAKGELRFLVEDEDRTSKSWYYLRNGAFVFSEKDVRAAAVTINASSGAVWSITTSEAIERRNGETTVYQLDIAPITYNLNVFEDSTGHSGSASTKCTAWATARSSALARRTGCRDPFTIRSGRSGRQRLVCQRRRLDAGRRPGAVPGRDRCKRMAPRADC